MSLTLNSLIFFIFFVSGFCSLLYQVVWIRLAYASFGVTTPVLSVVISLFMLGLALGSWLGGKWVSVLCVRLRVSAICLYAISEVFIGLGAFAVPSLFSLSENYLLFLGETDSILYLLYSAFFIAVSILPWCIFMGFTFPFMMAFLWGTNQKNTSSFSYLYLANVIGAMLGTLITAVVLIELLGFRNTLVIAACVNIGIALSCFAIDFFALQKKSCAEGPVAAKIIGTVNTGSVSELSGLTCPILFSTGLISMGMEVVWIRAFTPILKTMTYSFASLLSVYLCATWIGSLFYRFQLRKDCVLSVEKLLSGLALFSLIPIVINDPRLDPGIPSALLSIVPFCCTLGYLTPKLIDNYSMGQPSGAGKAYALNVLGCILGPLLASYFLLPLCGTKMSLLLLSLPSAFFVLIYYRKDVLIKDWSIIMTVLILFMFLRAGIVHISYEERFAKYPGSEVRRDHTASIVSVGSGMDKHLFVNGIGITKLNPVTKVMAHLPLLYCSGKPESALVICFGMGTTYRSLLSWDIETTAVELVPSVKKAFPYYFDDAEEILQNPMGRIVIDDGRRFLKRTQEKYDVITIDPPPPVETAGSSFLYSEEFYDLVKLRLDEGGVLHQWFPAGELKILQAVTRSLTNSFPYVQVYQSFQGWGFHFIASVEPLPFPTAEELCSRMPISAQQDLMEWQTGTDVCGLLERILRNKIPLKAILAEDKTIVVTDDRPYNEYYILRRLRALMDKSFVKVM